MALQPVLSDEMRPNTDAVAREYLEARAEARELGRQQREIAADQKMREGILLAFLEDSGQEIGLPGFDEVIYLGERTRKKMEPTGETESKPAVKVKKAEFTE